MLFREIIAVYYKNHDKDKDTLWKKHIYIVILMYVVCVPSPTTVQSVRINTHLHISHYTALLYVIGQFQQ